MKITSDSHLDHALADEHLLCLDRAFGHINVPMAATIEIPSWLPPLTCGLHGPIMGDEPVPESDVFYMTRGGRAYLSRVIKREPRETRLLTVISGMHNGECILFTAFGGPLAPQEFEDPRCQHRDYSYLFWTSHALSA